MISSPGGCRGGRDDINNLSDCWRSVHGMMAPASRCFFSFILALALAFAVTFAFAPALRAEDAPASATPAPAPAPATAPVPAAPKSEVQIKMDEASALVNGKKYVEAVAILNPLIEALKVKVSATSAMESDRSDLYMAYYLRSFARYFQRDLDGALDDINKALEIKTTINAMFQLGNVLSSQKKFDAAIGVFGSLLEYQQKNKEARMPNLARCLALTLACKGNAKDDRSALNLLRLAEVDVKHPVRRMYLYYVAWCICARQERTDVIAEKLRTEMEKEEERLKDPDAAKKLEEQLKAQPYSYVAPTEPVKGKDAPDKPWHLCIAHFLLDNDILPEHLLAAAKGGVDKATASQQLCEAHYYIAMKYRSKGKTNEAIKHLNLAVESKAWEMTEYILAEAELDLISRPPSTAEEQTSR